MRSYEAIFYAVFGGWIFDRYGAGVLFTSAAFLILPKSSKPPVIRALPGAKTLSSLIWRESAYAKNFERVAPACTLFRNRLGGEVAVMS